MIQNQPRLNRGISNLGKTFFFLLTVFLFSIQINIINGYAEDKYYSSQQEMVDRACITFNSFMSNPDMTWLRDNISSAKALFILPQSMRGSFIFGAQGGSGVLLAKNNRTGEWSYPAFYDMSSISFGLQAGAETSEIILMIMTDNGVDAILSTSFKLGADATIAAGPKGAGAMAATVDVVAFSQSQGVYGGISIKGAMIRAKDSWNNAYYGKYVRPVDILIGNNLKNPGAERLRDLIKNKTESIVKTDSPNP